VNTHKSILWTKSGIFLCPTSKIILKRSDSPYLSCVQLSGDAEENYADVTDLIIIIIIIIIPANG
jgi:hypothetical protein